MGDTTKTDDGVNHPAHYGGEGNPYEVIRVIDALDASFCLGNALKYLARAGKKGVESEPTDLKKALWYVEHEIERLWPYGGQGDIVRSCAADVVVLDPEMNARAVIRAWRVVPAVENAVGILFDFCASIVFQKRALQIVAAELVRILPPRRGDGR